LIKKFEYHYRKSKTIDEKTFSKFLRNIFILTFVFSPFDYNHFRLVIKDQFVCSLFDEICLFLRKMTKLC